MLTKEKSNNMFEIRVAFIGYVSVGKTTVINALFGDEFGEVAMKRTTAVVNSFRISSESTEAVVAPSDNDNDNDKRDSEDDSIEMVSNRLSASITLEETARDNVAFRNSNVVKERSFDIALNEPLHKMRSNTKLVIVDIPGINEAGTSSKYKDYVNANWHTFDIVVVVMDARQGVNTEEQHDLLKIAKNNMTNSKDIPLIVLGNKVDDPENEEQKALLEEARKTVEKMFEVNDREKALKMLLELPNNTTESVTLQRELFPVVVPISAMHAFLYRCGSRLSFKDFCKMDHDFIDKIGKDSYGRQWRRFDKRKKLEKAFQAVTDKEQSKDGLEASNFDAFSKVISVCIGDDHRQTLIIKKQVEVALARLETSSNIVDEVMVVHRLLSELGESIDHLSDTFWRVYNLLETKALVECITAFSPSPVAAAMNQLCKYREALETLNLPDEADVIAKAAKELVFKYTIRVTECQAMKAKTATERALILRSLMLPMCDPSFYVHYGCLRMHLESKLFDSRQENAVTDKCPKCSSQLQQRHVNGKSVNYCSSCNTCCIEENMQMCPNHLDYELSPDDGGVVTKKFDNYTADCGCHFYVAHRQREYSPMKVENGKLIPVDKKAYEKVVTLKVPESLDDPGHFGHVVWLFCNLMKKM